MLQFLLLEKKPTPSLESSGKDKQRNKKLFGALLLGTLQSFKKDLNKNKSTETAKRRVELEHKVEQKVQQDQEQFLQQQRRAIEEQKEKEQKARNDIKQKQEEIENKLLVMKWKRHHEELSHFTKTETKPCIFYKPNAKEVSAS